MNSYCRCDNHLGYNACCRIYYSFHSWPERPFSFYVYLLIICLVSNFWISPYIFCIATFSSVNAACIAYLRMSTFVHWMLLCYRNFVAFSHILRDMLNGLSWLVLTQLIFWTVSNAKIFITHRWVRIKLCCCEIEIFLRSIMLSLLLMLTAWCWK